MRMQGQMFTTATLTVTALLAITLLCCAGCANGNMSETELAIEKGLQLKVPDGWKLELEPLESVLEFLQEVVPFKEHYYIIDEKCERSEEFHLSATDGSTLKVALDIMLHDHGFAHAIWNDAILIATPKRIKELTSYKPLLRIPPKPNAKERAIIKALQTEMPEFWFNKRPLTDVIEFFQEVLQDEVTNEVIDYVLDKPTKDADVLILYRTAPTTLRTALNGMLHLHGLDYVIHNDAIFIGTPERIKEVTGAK
jgi:hypothetical protein